MLLLHNGYICMPLELNYLFIVFINVYSFFLMFTTVMIILFYFYKNVTESVGNIL